MSAKKGKKEKYEPQGDAERGLNLFKQMCIQCHTTAIRGIYGARIGAGNLNYTSGLLRRAQEKWTFEKLDAFLKNPKEFAGDTAMGAVAVKSAKDRRDLIEFLKI
ncbi:hypothetical protein FGO68_gene16992 [Halteria grandinella]|uniref:Cytochrome c domain-containing protein n=1 Tax=Halteria grandinella TaxID=5974 RepID=A0A8J8NBF1_HALGN|nr:hypothetical protein FGO68_gene3118 [Halteria grandinella]TNV75762.1 hypothetical protein FGO68_gene16992 [Halteria grandinella]